MASRAHHAVVVIAAQNNLGHLYRMERNYETAREFYDEALRASRGAGRPRKVALALEFLAETYTEEGRPAEALPLLEEALEIATPLASHGDLVMEILRRRGEAKLAIGNREDGLVDLRRAIALCGARGEIRERLLAERAFHMAFGVPVEEAATRMETVLNELQRIGDRFEYARTACLLLEDGRFDVARHPWLSDAQAAATHYFSSMGLKVWKERLQRVVGHAVRMRPEVAEPTSTSSQASLRTRSPVFEQALDAARLAAQSRDPALIVGETGVGKEVIARLVHRWSARAAGPLIGINCSAIPGNLIESELFGHVRGAFTGAERDRPGLFESANNGTVLLDEIGDLPAEVQAKLLRFLDHYEFHRVGEHRMRSVDVRILAATHKDLWKLAQEGVFREDLLFRLNVFCIEVPPLRQRREDIPALVEQFLSEESRSTLPIKVSPDLRRWLESYDWPGNVRELRNLCRYLAVRGWGKPEIGPRDLPPKLQATCLEFLSGASLSPFEREKLELERAQILRALQQSGGEITAASHILGLSRNFVARKIREHGIDRETFQRG
jgi:DNA-binding NtrC family response regulator